MKTIFSYLYFLRCSIIMPTMSKNSMPIAYDLTEEALESYKKHVQLMEKSQKRFNGRLNK